MYAIGVRAAAPKAAAVPVAALPNCSPVYPATPLTVVFVVNSVIFLDTADFRYLSNDSIPPADNTSFNQTNVELKYHD